MLRNTFCLIVMLMLTGAAMAQEAGPGAAANTSPLGVRQDHVRRLVQEMEDKFVRLSKAMEATEPEHARKIIDTLKAGKQALIEQRMAKVTELLNGGQLEQAEGEQRKLIAEIDKLIDLLTSTDDQRQREIEQLERFRREIEKLIAEQKDLKKRTDVTQHRDKAAAALDEQIAALRELIAAQKRLKEQTEQAKSRGVPAVMKLADEQGKLRRQTDALGRQIDAGPAGSPEAQTPEAQTPEGGDTPDGSKPGEQSGRAGKSQSLGGATERQDQAEQRMGDGQGVSAGKEQDKALEEMNKQLEKLEAKRDHIVRLPEDAMEKLSDPQNQLADKTGDLDKQMQAPGSPGSSEPGQQGQPGDSQDQQQQSTPGRPQVQQAQQQMRQASGEMQKQQGDHAQGHQRKAIEALKDARKQLEERLRQLRQETQEEKLAALEARFREMLSRQKPVTLGTGDLEVSRAAREAAEGKDARLLTRPERLQLNQLTAEEGVLAEMAAKAMDIIREDGTTVVLPEVVDQLHQDLRTAVKFLSGEETGAYAQGLEREIEKTLEELIDALRKAQEQQQQQGQQGQQGDQQQQQQPLVPESAELKLLKAAQVRINRRTELFDASRPDVRRLPAELAEEVRRLARRQEDVRQMAERLGQKR
ncbi:MAG: hypothetical protein ACYC26_06200 [Phycisphaerales bacterium]